MRRRRPPTSSDEAALRARLEAGYEQIETARQAGVDTRTWEEFWITLIREYETVLQEIIGAEEKETR